MPTIIAKFQQNAAKKSRVTLRDFKGRRRIATWRYSQDKAGKRPPTKQGIALTVEAWPELREALAKPAPAMIGEQCTMRGRGRREHQRACSWRHLGMRVFRPQRVVAYRM